MLYTASFYAPQDWVGHYYRVSRAHPRGKPVLWDTLPFLYPPLELLRAYRSGAVDFAAFTQEYRRVLDAGYGELAQFREWVDGLPSSQDLTLLCFERAGRPCHRVELARWLLERVPCLRCGKLR